MNIATYKIELVDEPIQIDGQHFDKSVLIKTLIDDEFVEFKKYGWLSKETIYAKIKKGEALNYSNAYILDFSISEYRELNGLENTCFVDLSGFKFQKCFFDCELNIDFSYINFLNETNFNATIFSNGGVSFYYSKFQSDSPIDFKNVVFGKGSVNFQYVSFGDSDTIFSFVKFYGGTVSFVNANFMDGNVRFNSARFYNSKVKFHFSKFGKGDVEFNKARFGDESVDFRKVEFGEGKVDFRRLVVGNAYVTFDEAEFVSGKVKFSSSRFGNGDLSFERINFNDAIVFFENVDFGRGEVSFKGIDVNYISFRKSKIDVFLNFCVKRADVVDFSEIILRDIIDMKTDHHNVHIKTMYLTGMRNLGRFIFNWEENKLESLIKSQKNTTTEEKAEQFTIIKENFSAAGLYEQEDLAYIQFKRFEYQNDYNSIIKNGIKSYWRLPGMWFKWLVFDKMGLFATSPLRVLFSMFSVYVIYSFIYFLMPILGIGDIVNSVDSVDSLSYLQTCFYHSAITYLTIGYGDYYPTEFSRVISIVEGWSGLFLMSYFTIAFVRKILR